VWKQLAACNDLRKQRQQISEYTATWIWKWTANKGQTEKEVGRQHKGDLEITTNDAMKLHDGDRKTLL